MNFQVSEIGKGRKKKPKHFLEIVLSVIVILLVVLWKVLTSWRFLLKKDGLAAKKFEFKKFYQESTWTWQKIVAVLMTAMFAVMMFGYWMISQIGVKNLVFSLGDTLQMDLDRRSNFLLLGNGVLGQNEGSDLTDTIIVGSYLHETNSVVLLSLPRDLYVKNDQVGGMRINTVLSAGNDKLGPGEGIKVLEKEVEEMMGIDIHYTIQVNFNALKEIVDSLGGVEIDVQSAITDLSYPKDGTNGYDPFIIKKGLQTLDGETALKYARSRKTTSDFDRARRQQQLIFAIKQKAMKREILSNPVKIKALYDSVSSNMEMNLELRELIELARLGESVNRSNINSYVLNTENAQCGGFLYEPRRDYYGGAAVLVPVGDSFDYIQRFVSVVLDKNFQKGSKIKVFNGTKSPGLAGEVGMKLSRYCFDVLPVANAPQKGMENTALYYKKVMKQRDSVETGTEVPVEYEPAPVDLEVIRDHFVDGSVVEGFPIEYFEYNYAGLNDADIAIELGDDYVKTREVDPFLRFIYGQVEIYRSSDKTAEDSSNSEEATEPAADNEVTE